MRLSRAALSGNRAATTTAVFLAQIRQISQAQLPCNKCSKHYSFPRRAPNAYASPDLPMSLEERINKFRPAVLGAGLSDLSENERGAVRKLCEAARLADKVYMRQVWSGNEELYATLQKDAEKNARVLEYYGLMKGPWDRLNENEPFVKGVPMRPKGGNFYPEDMTMQEFEDWLVHASEEDRKHAQGFYHVIRRDVVSGGLVLVPYSSEYEDLLRPASKLLREAADLVDDASLAKFLNSRAESLMTNEYLDSELDWLRISPESRLEITFGPYEVYTDQLYATKAAFEAYIHMRDFQSSALLKKFEDCLQDVEDHLPVPDEYKSKDLKPTPIVVVNELFSGGDVALPMTAAYNLPNDEKAIKKGGSKLIIIRNVQQSKYKEIMKPIGDLLIDPKQLHHMSFDGFFTHILLHEVAHSNGPHFTIGHRPVKVRAALKELHSPYEEAKADIAGLHTASYLIDKGIIQGITKESFWVTFLAGSFRGIRFGLDEAHGKGHAIQMNYLLDNGGFIYNRLTKKFSVDLSRIEASVAALTQEIMMIQGDGDKARAEAFAKKYGVVRDYVVESLVSLENAVPVDVRPVWSVEH